MLSKLHTYIFIVGLLAIGFMAVITYEKAIDLMTLIPVGAFVTQICLILFFSRDDIWNSFKKPSETTLFFTVLVYSLMLGTVYMWISYYYDGDTFMFSKTDAMAYYTESMRVADVGFLEVMTDLTQRKAFDDWGAYFFDCLMMSIIPSKLFLNAIYMILGATSSILLYRIAQHYMPDMYAFIAALGYGTSSFLIFYSCTFLKEPLFVFLVISTVYHFYQYLNSSSRFSLFAMILCLVCVLFFRPAVAGMLAVSALAYYGITQNGKAISLFIYMGAAVAVVISMTMMKGAVDAYTAGGDVDAVIAYRSNENYSGSFNYFVSFFGAYLGPFPTIFSKEPGVPSHLQFYGSGLTYRLFFMFPFWYGVYTAYRKKALELLPIILFIVLEMCATAYIVASMELRKVLLHVPFMYVLSFYGIYHVFKSERAITAYKYFNFVFVLGVLFLWNVIKVKT